MEKYLDLSRGRMDFHCDSVKAERSAPSTGPLSDVSDLIGYLHRSIGFVGRLKAERKRLTRTEGLLLGGIGTAKSQGLSETK